MIYTERRKRGKKNCQLGEEFNRVRNHTFFIYKNNNKSDYAITLLKALNLDNVRIIPPLIGCHLLLEGSIPYHQHTLHENVDRILGEKWTESIIYKTKRILGGKWTESIIYNRKKERVYLLVPESFQMGRTASFARLPSRSWMLLIERT